MATSIAFQSWENGGIQTSGLYRDEEVAPFVEQHYQSGTFATLLVFEGDEVAEGLRLYDELNQL